MTLLWGFEIHISVFLFIIWAIWVFSKSSHFVLHFPNWLFLLFFSTLKKRTKKTVFFSSSSYSVFETCGFFLSSFFSLQYHFSTASIPNTCVSVYMIFFPHFLRLSLPFQGITYLQTSQVSKITCKNKLKGVSLLASMKWLPNWDCCNYYYSEWYARTAGILYRPWGPSVWPVYYTNIRLYRQGFHTPNMDDNISAGRYLLRPAVTPYTHLSYQYELINHLSKILSPLQVANQFLWPGQYHVSNKYLWATCYTCCLLLVYFQYKMLAIFICFLT